MSGRPTRGNGAGGSGGDNATGTDPAVLAQLQQLTDQLATLQVALDASKLVVGNMEIEHQQQIAAAEQANALQQLKNNLAIELRRVWDAYSASGDSGLAAHQVPRWAHFSELLEHHMLLDQTMTVVAEAGLDEAGLAVRAKQLENKASALRRVAKMLRQLGAEIAANQEASEYHYPEKRVRLSAVIFRAMRVAAQKEPAVPFAVTDFEALLAKPSDSIVKAATDAVKPSSFYRDHAKDGGGQQDRDRDRGNKRDRDNQHVPAWVPPNKPPYYKR